jgi:hypothetical protein
LGGSDFIVTHLLDRRVAAANALAEVVFRKGPGEVQTAGLHVAARAAKSECGCKLDDRLHHA